MRRGAAHKLGARFLPVRRPLPDGRGNIHMESDVRHWTLSDVSLWLQSMDMACYAEAFESNRIDGEALVLMDEAALKDIGVASIGHRVSLLDAIYQMKIAHNIPFEPGDWVPQELEPPTYQDMTQLLRERDERIYALESHVSYLDTALMQLHEQIAVISKTLGVPHTARVQQSQPPLTHTASTSTEAQDDRDGQARALQATAPLPWSESAQDDRTLAPVLEAIGALLRQRGMERAPNEAQQRFHPVTLNDPCSTLLPLALRLYGIHEDWHNVLLFATSSTTEYCIAYDEKPLRILQTMQEKSPDAALVARYVADIESPVQVAYRKFHDRQQQKQLGMEMKHPALRQRAGAPGLPVAKDARLISTRHLLTWPGGAEAHSHAHTRGPAADLAFKHISYAVAIYPYVSERDDEFDFQLGDTFIVLSKSQGWWALRRDSAADGHGDVYVLDRARPSIEVWTGWAPTGCLLEIVQPMATILHSQSCYRMPDSQDTWQQIMMYAPLPLLYVPMSGSAATLLTDLPAQDHSFSAGDRVRVFKRYHSWSYCIAESMPPYRGWVPSWLLSRRMNTPIPPSRALSSGSAPGPNARATESAARP